MKTIRELNIKDWSGYFFEEMVQILYIDPECFMVDNVKECTDGTMFYNIYYSDKIGVPHIVFNNIDCYFLKLMIICYTIKKNNIPVCVISLSSVIEKENIHYPLFRLQKCFDENENF